MANLKISLNGTIYQITEKAFRNTDYWKKPITPYFYASYVAAGQLVKQWVKNNYPNVVCRVKGSSFANGNSMDVNVCMPDGSPVPDAVYRAISEFAHLFEYGRYDGMHDMYESYENSGLRTDNGTELQAGVKYVSTNNKPAWDTPQYVLDSVRRGESTWDTIGRYITPKVMEQARELANLI